MGVVTPLDRVTKNRWIIYLKEVKFMICKICLMKLLKRSLGQTITLEKYSRRFKKNDVSLSTCDFKLSISRLFTKLFIWSHISRKHYLLQTAGHLTMTFMFSHTFLSGLKIRGVIVQRIHKLQVNRTEFTTMGHLPTCSDFSCWLAFGKFLVFGPQMYLKLCGMGKY